MRQNVLTAILSIAILIVLYFLFFDRKETDHPLIPSQDRRMSGDVETITSPRSRTIREVPEESITILRLDSMLVNPRDVIVQGNEIFISDPSTYSIKRFKLDGRYVSSIGKGPGRGPGEFTGSSDFAVDQSSLWIVTQRRVLKYTLNGVYVSQFDVENSPYRIAKSDTALIIAGLTSWNPLRLHSISDSLLVEYGDELSEQGGPLSIQGHIDTDESHLYYAMKYASFVYHYSPEGELKRIIQTIDKLSVPSNKRETNTAGQPVMRSPDRDTMVVDLEIDRGLIYIDTYFRTPYRHTVIDTYDLETGRYLSSARLPTSIFRMDVVDGRVYGVKDTSIVVFDYPDSE